MKYRDLPDEGLPSMTCDNSECEHWHVLYSARRGDYFLQPDGHDVKCACGAPMFLATEITTTVIHLED